MRHSDLAERSRSVHQKPVRVVANLHAENRPTKGELSIYGNQRSLLGLHTCDPLCVFMLYKSSNADGPICEMLCLNPCLPKAGGFGNSAGQLNEYQR